MSRVPSKKKGADGLPSQYLCLKSGFMYCLCNKMYLVLHVSQIEITGNAAIPQTTAMTTIAYLPPFHQPIPRPKKARSTFVGYCSQEHGSMEQHLR